MEAIIKPPSLFGHLEDFTALVIQHNALYCKKQELFSRALIVF
jgi:hypothetical protein